jgi:hypothetical protein
LPKGSETRPSREPKNISVIGMMIFAPACTARSNSVSEGLSPGARECKTLQSVSSRREDAGRNRRHLDGIGAIKLEAAPRYPFASVSTRVQPNALPDRPRTPVSVQMPLRFPHIHWRGAARLQRAGRSDVRADPDAHAEATFPENSCAHRY